jgi:hypothetical protein
MWMWQSVCGPDFQDNLNHMPNTHKTPAPWPDRQVSCSRTPTKHRTWNSIWENTKNEQVQQTLDSFHQPEESHSICRPGERRYTQHTAGHLVISFGSTKPPAHPEYGDRISSWNVGKPSHLNAVVCLRKFHCIHISVTVLQSCQPITNYNLIMFNLHIT